ncbi:MAG: hypothetical protein U9R50_11725 [Campylobacterota bacterium]|nr:hypothetical protein [Campylobacterota bacterium]
MKLLKITQTNVLLSIFFLLHVSINAFAEEVIDIVEISAQEKQKFIEVSDVPSSAALAIKKINDISEKLQENKTISQMHTSLESYAMAIDAMLDNPLNEYLEYVPIRQLKKTENDWSIYLTQLNEWNEERK